VKYLVKKGTGIWIRYDKDDNGKLYIAEKDFIVDEEDEWYDALLRLNDTRIFKLPPNERAVVAVVILEMNLISI